MPDLNRLCVFSFVLLVGMAGRSVSQESPPQSSISIQADPLDPRSSMTAIRSFVDGSDQLFERLKKELKHVRRRYARWGVTRETKVYGTVSVGSSGQRDIDWSRQTPTRVIRERFLRSDDRFRSDCFQPASDRRVFSYDGKVGRIRDMYWLHNGPLSELASAFEDDFAPLVPHTVLVDFFFAPDLGWIYGTSSASAMLEGGSLVGKVRVGEEEFDGHPCWRVNWRVIRDQDGGVITNCEAWLAKDRSLLPIYQEFGSKVDVRSNEYRQISTDSFEFHSSSGLWYPKEVTASRRFAFDLQITRVSFEPTDQFNDPAIYSDSATVSPEQSKPPKAVVSQYTPPSVLTGLPGTVVKATDVTHVYRRHFAGFGTIGLILAFAGISFCLRMTRLGRLLREFAGRHRTLLGLTGLLLTVGVGLLSAYPTGWTKYGLTMMSAGGFGLCWIVFSIALVGEKTVSIKQTLFAAACTALFFGGYSQGVKRMQVRQRMIREVRDQGGQVVMGLWRLDEAGLYLPRGLRRLLGEAWSGRANRAAVEEEFFTGENVDDWCLDEVQWLGIASKHRESFEVDRDALAGLGGSNALWTLHIEGGYLDDDDFSELARFSRLIDLHYDCQNRPVSEKIRFLPEIERLWLTNAVIDDALIDSLSQVETLEFVTFIKPRFGNCDRTRSDFKLSGVEVQFSNLTPAALNTLGQLPTNLLLVDCNFQLSSGAEVVMPATQAISVRGSDLDDRGIVKLVDSPKLKVLNLSKTDVSVVGVEAFSELRSEVSMMLD